jgi:hypothetical protein
MGAEEPNIPHTRHYTTNLSYRALSRYLSSTGRCTLPQPTSRKFGIAWRAQRTQSACLRSPSHHLPAVAHRLSSSTTTTRDCEPICTSKPPRSLDHLAHDHQSRSCSRASNPSLTAIRESDRSAPTVPTAKKVLPIVRPPCLSLPTFHTPPPVPKSNHAITSKCSSAWSLISTPCASSSLARSASDSFLSPTDWLAATHTATSASMLGW